MKLYLLTLLDTLGYDSYDSCVVCAESEDDAKLIHPSGFSDEDKKAYHYDQTWTFNPSDINCTLIVYASENTERGVILASFNAG
jgi:hypothetical protein